MWRSIDGKHDMSKVCGRPPDDEDRALRAAIRDLPFDLRAPLVLRQFEGCSYEQAAEILGISVSTVRGRIARARRTLLTSMREWR